MGKPISVPPMDCDKGLVPHSLHQWRGGFLWLQRYYCIGMPFPSVTDWRKANHHMGYLIKDSLGVVPPIPHKHRYQVKNKVLVTPQGMAVSRANVYWQCADRNCWNIYSMSREAVREELMKKPIYQTWPG